MTNAQRRLRKLLPLGNMEQAFLYLHQNSIPLNEADPASPELRAYFGKEDSGVAQGYSEFAGVVDDMREGESLPERQFFLPDRNVAVNIHPRYMPAIPHSHDFFEIQYLLTGTLTQTVDEVSVTLNAGDLCFIAPFARHAPHVTDDGTLLVNLLVRAGTLRSAFANSLTEKDAISEFFLRVLSGQTYQPLLLCRTGQDEKIIHLILDMLDERDACDIYADKLLRTMMEQLFIFMLRAHKDGFDLGKSLRKQDDTILTILRYIQQHYTELSLSALARHFNYSETYLSFLIHSYTGHTFSEMVTDLRLQYVARRLAGSEDNVSDIAAEAGYSNQTHFYRLFRRRFGMTPTEFRLLQCRGKALPEKS